MLVCPACKSLHPSVLKLKQHLEKFHLFSGKYPPPYFCGQLNCSKKFDALEAWRRHLKGYHSHLENEESTTAENVPSFANSPASATCISQNWESSDISEPDRLEDSPGNLEEIGSNSNEPNIEEAAVRFVSQMRANSSVPISVTLTTIDQCNVITYLQTKVKHFLDDQNLTGIGSTELLNELDFMRGPLEFLNSDWKQKA